jgi:hypothetical protein
VQSVPQGTFLAWLSSRERLGGQYKVTRLSNDRNIIDEVKQLI